MLWSTFLMALREVRRNLMRSILTMLGVVIGVGAVIALVTVGEGATQAVTSNIASMGQNLLMVMPSRQQRGGPTGTAGAPFTLEDVEALKKEVTGASLVAPTVSKSLIAVSGSTNWGCSVTGTTVDFFETRGYAVETGRLWSHSEETSGRGLCVLGTTTKEKLFGSGDPVGETIRVDKISCEVIGVLASKGANSFGSDADDLIVVPLRLFQTRVTGTRDVSMIYVSAAEDQSTNLVKTRIQQLLRDRRRIPIGQEDDFNVRDMAEVIQTASQVTGVLTGLLGAIAAVSLLVGGIGIMNIMLVSVTERTREIGIRLAIGALARDVLVQFLIEAIVLSTLGGIIGLVLGLAGAYFAARALSFPFVFLPEMVVTAFVFSAFVGVLFGFLPARKAARLNPIDALRHE
jgi:putative ABC transport system permease protein